ncbi:MAG: glutamate synthase small subunit [Chitinivibrionales bacterium]|nr:glutamate synthase small subunit [Chitinivibrionales bacterium]MBD3394110.1 glutamate synthase small subunit [Chitinivibrionales bacterium]
MGKPTGFVEYERITAPARPVEERVKDFREVAGRLAEDELRRQGARCMDCGIPFCHALGCPVYNLIPEFNDAAYRGRWREALERLERTNTLPEITGRICPAPCEAACTLSINAAPVTIKQLELSIIEKGFEEGWVVPRPPRVESGRRVAIVGSGPAGLAAAQRLRRMGHAVTVFDKARRIGGILRYGIPDFKLEKWVLDRRLEQMRAEGVEFATDVVIGEDLSGRYLRKQFDAVLLCMGAGEPRDLHVPGRGLEGIHFAMDYLTQSNMRTSGEADRGGMDAAGKRVLVIGGGDTGSDCVGTAIRQGARKVYLFEIMPKPREWTEAYNPEWPAWPAILRTSSSHEEGCERDWAVATTSFTGRGVAVEEGSFVRVEWKDRSRGGRRRMTEVPGTEFSLKLDMVVLAMGFVHVQHSRLLEDLGIAYDAGGNVATDAGYRTSVDGVFAAGDAGIGASLVVRAIFHGQEAAGAIGQYLA